jgi:hypothetical protein
VYSGFLKGWQIRTMMLTALIINMFGAATTILYTTQNTFGLPPLAFVCLTSTVTDTLYRACYTLPAMVLFAKLIPENVESSMFALVTGLMNFSKLFASKELGILCNIFIGVRYSPEDNTLNLVWQLFCI